MSLEFHYLKQVDSFHRRLFSLPHSDGNGILFTLTIKGFSCSDLNNPLTLC